MTLTHQIIAIIAFALLIYLVARLRAWAEVRHG